MRANLKIVARAVLAVTLAIGVGYGAVSQPASYLLLGVASLGLVILLKDRWYVLAAIAVLYLFGGSTGLPHLMDVGGFSLRLDDVLFALMFFDSVMRLRRIPLDPLVRRSLLRITLPVGIFITYVAMTLFLVARGHPQEMGMALAAFARFPVTSLYIIIAYTSFSTEYRLHSFVRLLSFLGAVSVLVASFQFLSAPVLTMARRVSGFQGPNELGIVSGLLVLLAVVQFRHRILGSTMLSCVALTLGLLGIFLSKSISSTLAMVVAVSAYQFLRIRRDMLSIVRVLVGLGIAASLSLVLFVSLRAGDVQGLVASTGGSFFHRLLLAQAGWEIFKQNPIWGVGWRMSSLPEVIGATDIGIILRSKYRGLAEHMFPDVTVTSVHNMYLQFLTELGLVGMLLFVGVVVYLGFAIRAILNESGHDSRLRAYGEYFALGLVFLLVWWNTNPLYGGQLETFLCFLFLGGIAAISNILRRSM